MTYFQEYMTKTLERDVDWVFSDQDRTKGMDFLVKYYRMKNAIVFKLSNDVVQVRSGPDIYLDLHIQLTLLILHSSTSLITPRFC
jgi:hypothetical protein